MLITLVSLAAIQLSAGGSLPSQTKSDAATVIIVKNGASPLPSPVRRLLHLWDDGDAAATEKLGYKRIQVDGHTVLFVDPTAPPLGEFHAQRVLLQEFGGLGKSKRFGDLSPEAQAVVRQQLTPSVIPQFELTNDTQIGQMGTFQVRFTSGGKNFNESCDVKQSSSYQQDNFLKSLRSNPMGMSKLGHEAIVQQTKEVGGYPSSEMLFGGSLAQSSVKQVLYGKCAALVEKLATDERALRDAAYAKVVAELEAANPELKGGSPNSWDKGNLPKTYDDALKQKFLSGWSVYGFDSKESASSAWNSSSIYEAGISFNLVVSLNSGGPLPEYFRTQYGTTAR